jgi:hypothetical protein
METREPGLTCAEKSRLIEAYAVSVSDYNRTVQTLRMRSGTFSMREYGTLRDIVNKAIELSQLTLAALDQHTAEHGC